MLKAENIQKEMNHLGSECKPFVFLIDFLMQNPMIFEIGDPENPIFWKTPGSEHYNQQHEKKELKYWKISPVSFEKYSSGFNKIMFHILNGDTYLLNFTQPTKIETNLTIEDIFYATSAPYKIYLRDRFVCFSPETFIQIRDGKIFSFPMKGTIDADIENADQIILTDTKEIAEHNTIVDLIRNDLSLIAENVFVEKFRFLTHIKTNNKNLWQVSSKISGDLPKNYNEKIGDIIFKMLPAGSISGAPKKRTIEIISDAENYERGFYTGIFGIFDGKDVESCVLIRYIENQNGQLVYKSGGGITFMSNAKNEYDELIKKVYVPID